jgi:hypothetical protein
VHGLYCFALCFADSSLLVNVCIDSLLSLVHHYWAWFVLFQLMLHWFIITGHDLYCLTTRFTGSSLLGMVFIVSLHA